MTAQVSDTLIYKGERNRMAMEPLRQYLEKRKIKFRAMYSCCWRGYHGTWEIRDNKLFLIDFRGYVDDYQEVGLDYLFPKDDEVFASWFTGEVRMTKGKILKYVHGGYYSIYEKDVILTLKKGVLISEVIRDNREDFLNGNMSNQTHALNIERTTLKPKSFWHKLFCKFKY